MYRDFIDLRVFLVLKIIILLLYSNLFVFKCRLSYKVSGQLPPPSPPPSKIAPRLGLGFGSRLGLVLGLRGNKITAPRKIGPLLW